MAEAVRSTVVSRRTVLRSAVGVGAAALVGLAGCGSSKSATSAAPRIATKVDGNLSWFTWAQYVDPKVVASFEKHYGVKVNQTFFDSDDLMIQKLATGLPYDLVTTNSSYMNRLIPGGVLQSLDLTALKNHANLDSFFLSPPYDNGTHRYSVPYGCSPTGYIYRSDKVDHLESGWDTLFANPEAKRHIFLIDQVDETLGMSLQHDGVGLNSGDASAVSAAVDRLIELKPMLGGLSSNIQTDIPSGNSWLSHSWPGSALQAIQAAPKSMVPHLRFVLPKGAPFGCDTLSIGAKAKSPGTAMLFIDWMLRPDNAAANATFTGYPNGTTSGDASYSKLVASYPFLDLGPNFYRTATFKLSATGSRLALWNQQWSRFLAA